LLGLPLLLELSFLSWRFIGESSIAIVWILGLPALLLLAWKLAQKYNRQWLVRQLDLRRSDLENSSDLLFAEPDGLSHLQQLQQQRVQQRISSGAELDLRTAWPWQRLIIALVASGLLIALALYYPMTSVKTAPVSVVQKGQSTSMNGPVRLQSAFINVRAPAYTGLPARNENTLNVKVPEGSKLSWALTFKPQPRVAELVFLDGKRIALKAQNGVWRAVTVLSQSSLYRIEINGKRMPEDKLNRLQVIKDLAPVLRVIAPDRSLTLAEFEQDYWDIDIEASDDYGLAAAQLRIQLAQGAGENIKFSQFTQTIVGKGNAKQKRFASRIKLAELGLLAGDDLIVQMSVSDLRTPKASISLSPSFILRWPPKDSTEASGVEGMLKKVAPAYFRSQRQIIIDTEKLIAQRKKLSQDDYERRSDQIGVDQRLLRLRYGQFLGEETGGGEQGEHSDEHASEPPTKTTSTADILSEYGHTHDIPEAATLLDSKTKELLRAALNEMWRAELHLRQVQPKLALPYENRALALIKKVQQADRIYLVRTGNESPPIDETRRLSGDRKNLSSGKEQLYTQPITESALHNFWQVLNALPSAKNNATLDFNALQTWINTHQESLPDILSLLSALDALQQTPDCLPCREQVRMQLWPLLAKPVALPNSRTMPSTNGKRYLQDLSKDKQP
jgi:hypothetical protein